jgi:hypothetical protein
VASPSAHLRKPLPFEYSADLSPGENPQLTHARLRIASHTLPCGDAG